MVNRRFIRHLLGSGIAVVRRDTPEDVSAVTAPAQRLETFDTIDGLEGAVNAAVETQLANEIARAMSSPPARRASRDSLRVLTRHPAATVRTWLWR